MKFKEIGGSKVYRNWLLWEEGDYVIGKFVSTSKDNFGKDNYQIEIIETNQQFDPDHHYIPSRGKNKGKKVFDTELKVGETVSLNGTGSLSYKMEMVNEGEVVRITYAGTGELPDDHQYAGSTFHKVDVDVAEVETSQNGEESIESFAQL